MTVFFTYKYKYKNIKLYYDKCWFYYIKTRKQ